MTLAQTAKIDRKLYVGNLPPGINQQHLLNVMNNAITSTGLIKESGNPVVSSWISTDGHYGFIEFRSADEANMGFNLQGMEIGGCQIKIGRPKAYDGTLQTLGIPTGIGLTMPRLSSLVQDGFDRMGERGDFAQSWRLPDYYYIVSLPSNVLRISNVATFANTKKDEDYGELFADIWDKCTEILDEYELLQYGMAECEMWDSSEKVKSLKIPRPVFVDRSEQNKKDDDAKAQHEAEEEKRVTLDPKVAKKRERLLAKIRNSQKEQKAELQAEADMRNYDLPEGFGHAYVEFFRPQDCQVVFRALNLMKYNDKIIECSFYNAEMYECNVLKGTQKVKRQTLAYLFPRGGFDSQAYEQL